MAAAVSLSFFTLSLQLKAHIQCLLVSILSHYCFPNYHITIPCTLPLLSAILTAQSFASHFYPLRQPHIVFSFVSMISQL